MRKSKELFTALGQVVEVEGKNKFVYNSPDHLRSCLKTLPKGKQIACTFTIHSPSRSSEQLNYHFALLRYLAEHTGHTPEELHDAIMRIKFGTKTIKLGAFSVNVRKSIANKANMPMNEMNEVIDYDLKLCADYGIVVPTAEELGYISNKAWSSHQMAPAMKN